MAIKQSSTNFNRMVSEHARRFKLPSRVMFELTYRCNFRCVHCYVTADESKKELTAVQVKHVLDQLASAGCYHVGFTGGEVFLREDLFDILEHAKRCGLRISILTNGFFIDKGIAERLAALGRSLNRVDVSVLGATEKTLEKITGVKGSHERIFRSIRLLKDAGIYVQLKATLLTLNKDEFLNIRSFARENDLVFRYSPTVCARVDGDTAPLQYQVSPEEVRMIKERIAQGAGAVDESVTPGSSPPRTGRQRLFRCGAGETEATISPYGELNFCMEIPYPQYDIIGSSFADCWKKMKDMVERLELPEEYLCRDCALASFCHWCPARAWSVGRDLFSCDPGARRAALDEARHSRSWEALEPIWERQKKRFR